MQIFVGNLSMIQCSFGIAPGQLMVLPLNKVIGNKSMPMANINDNKPMLNILPFGMCNSISNPTVAAATAAALGVLTPMPCVPVTVAPWAPGHPKVMISNMPALTHTCKLQCMWGGVIQVVMPQPTTIISNS